MIKIDFSSYKVTKGITENNAYGMVISEFVTKSHFSQLTKCTPRDLESKIGRMMAF